MIGIIAAEAASKATGDEDPSAVVVDEVVGMLIAGFFARDHGWVALVIAFGLFRLLDITKPGIIDKAQRVGPPGIAILLDDVLAGFGAGFGVWLAGRYLL
jgi:phosphatidylglycerophosphatase A